MAELIANLCASSRAELYMFELLGLKDVIEGTRLVGKPWHGGGNGTTPRGMSDRLRRN